jgi:hypothetical protein
VGLTVDTRITKKFKHLVQVCSAEDVADGNGGISYQKKMIFEGWAMIVARRAQTVDPYGNTVMEERDRRTHFIHMRYRPNVLITSSGWIYEHRRLSAPRWFKILHWMDELEDGQYWKIECVQYEVSDDAPRPIETPTSNRLHSLPEGVEL